MNHPCGDEIHALSHRAALIVTGIDNIETTAASLASQLQLTVEIASNRSAALRLLGRRVYTILILDELLAESDPEGANLLWKHAGLAIPLQMNFALAGSERLEREVRAALTRRQREQQLAGAAAVAALDLELKDAITDFLLESRLALAETNLPPPVGARLQAMARIAENLHDRLGCSALQPPKAEGAPQRPLPMIPSSTQRAN